MTGQRPVSTADEGGRWWISDGPIDSEPAGEKILGPFASRDLALEVRALYEAHPRANGMTYWVSQEPRRHLTAVPPRAGDDLRETCKAVLAEHDDPTGWTCDDADAPVYECQCGDRSPALDHDHIYPEDVEAAAAWHRAHVADTLTRALLGDTAAPHGQNGEAGRG